MFFQCEISIGLHVLIAAHSTSSKYLYYESTAFINNLTILSWGSTLDVYRRQNRTSKDDPRAEWAKQSIWLTYSSWIPPPQPTFTSFSLLI